jgi:ribonuclease BN (tRNA processing enzyme)
MDPLAVRTGACGVTALLSLMQIRVLGCSGSIAAGSRTTAFLLGSDVLIDAGTGVGDLTLDEMVAIDHIVITHSHLDHVLAIGLLADSVTRRRRAAERPPIGVHALPETIAALKAHVFNGVIWPDFSRLPDPTHPVLRFHTLAVGQHLQLGDHHLEVLPARHTVPAVGYAVHGSQGAWVFTGDTGPNAALWQRLAQMHVAMLVIETAFRDDEAALAGISQHLCPAMLAQELRQLQHPTEVCITHIKPGEVEAVMAEITAQGGPHRVRALDTGDVMLLATAAATPARAANG